MGESSSANTSPRPYIIAALVLAAIVIVSLAFVLFGTSKKPGVNANTAASTAPPGTTANTGKAPLEPAEVHARSGTVTKIDGKSISFVTPAYNDATGDFEMKEFEARTDGSTIYKKIDPERPATPASPGSAQLVPATVSMSRSDLVKGDGIDVTSKENMRTATSVLASQIIKLP